MQDTNEKSKEEVARKILDYFLRNPEAADNLTGIARWRLLEEAVQRSVETTEVALNWLIEQGYLLQVSLKGAERIFRLNREKRRDAEVFLHEKRSGEE